MRKQSRKFSSEILGAFRHACTCGADEYDAACLALHILLGRPPWAEDVMVDVDTNEPPAYIKRRSPADAQNAETWAAARKLRLELELAAG